MNIQNKAILITGANRGIGWASSTRRFGAEQRGFYDGLQRHRAIEPIFNFDQAAGRVAETVNPSKFVVQTLKLVGLLNLFEIFPDTQAAAASFS